MAPPEGGRRIQRLKRGHPLGLLRLRIPPRTEKIVSATVQTFTARERRLCAYLAIRGGYESANFIAQRGREDIGDNEECSDGRNRGAHHRTASQQRGARAAQTRR